jgi:hypothetical protein
MNSRLSSLAKLTRLRVLWLDGTEFTREGINRLKSLLPGCTIHWNNMEFR